MELKDALPHVDIATLRNRLEQGEVYFVKPNAGKYAVLNRDESLAILDRLSPPEQPDEATKIWRGMMHAGNRVRYPNGGDNYYLGGEWDNATGSPAEIAYLRQVLSELIASKDAEIERLKGEADEGEKLAEQYRNIAEDIESERSALRAENERLKEALAEIAGPINTTNSWYQSCRRYEELAAATLKAAERKPAEPVSEIEAACNRMAARMGGKFVKNESWPEVVATTDTAPVVEVTEVDRKATELILMDAKAADVEPYWSRTLRHVSRIRTEAEARGRRKALEEAMRVVERADPNDGLAARLCSRRIANELKHVMEKK